MTMNIQLLILKWRFAFRWNCACRYRPRRVDESRREWIKDTSCMYHWMKSDYYKRHLANGR